VVVFISVSLGFPVPVADALLIPAMAARLQLKVVPVVALEGLYENRVFVQIAGGVKELDKDGVGLTVTVTFCWFEHPLAVNVKT